MSRIEGKFRELKIRGRKALITFVTAGDPDLEGTAMLVKEMEKRGADIIELGIPYSDPVAEGPVIQNANRRALSNGIKIKDIMHMASEVRKEVGVPLVYLLYLNCILQYGAGRFMADCAHSGIDGIIVPDLPYEEKDEISGTAEEHGIDLISLVSPSSRDRVETIAAGAKGFLYCVSSMGVTGMRSSFDTDFESFFSPINRVCKIPKALGFGISTPEQVSQLKKYCDGLIVGSAVVRQVENSSSRDGAVRNVGDFVQSLRLALDN